MKLGPYSLGLFNSCILLSWKYQNATKPFIPLVLVSFLFNMPSTDSAPTNLYTAPAPASYKYTA